MIEIKEWMPNVPNGRPDGGEGSRMADFLIYAVGTVLWLLILGGTMAGL